MDQEDPRSEAAAKSRRSAKRALQRLRLMYERERRQRIAQRREARQQEALDPDQALLRALSAPLEMDLDRTRQIRRIDRNRRLFEEAERALVDGNRPLVIIGAPTNSVGVAQRLRLVELANEVDARVIYIDDRS